ncbi:1-acyl-sn-glycerol-3-phosphate acyltransferase [Sphingomonas sp. A2-49]|uniref:lysophospholipid acyltransferase family protein n=1 Tax=Sphingomonas sp. A2-49 TaxID=1391375 RepID=UPI0021D35196|nr:lysophospholipid acyltransferase family protein [Sphingomonas sp. A2-49]MCU6455578.1 1-acyl-sn-glycerol-3-phosphate acyltransferase [Sphingomonas sp. A2-49]
MIANLRLARRLVLLVLALAGALLLHGAWRAVRAPSPWPRRFLGGVARIVGARVRVIGTPLRRDVVFLSNHLSWIDILAIAGASGSAFVAKGELRGVPLVGWLCTLNRTIFVTREDRLQVAAQIARLRDAIGAGGGVTIFPEGTTGDGRTLLPFKAALLAALDPPPPGVRVQPVGVDYGDATDTLAWVGDEPGGAHALRVLRRRGTFAVTLHMLDPFDPAMAGNRKAIAARARAAIAAVTGPPVRRCS